MEVAHWKEVLSSGASPDLEAFKLRDSDHFSVGGLHQNVEAWINVLEGHQFIVVSRSNSEQYTKNIS